MPRKRKTGFSSSRSVNAEEEEEPMEEEVAEEEEDDCDEDEDDEEGEGSEEGGTGGRGRGGRERPGQRNAANARERARMRVLSRAFCRLKTTLPWVPPDTKLSKLDTLRLATSYIAHLRAMLAAEAEAESVASAERPAAGAGKGAAAATATAGGGGNSPDRNRGRVSTLHPLNLTWPFSFQRSSSSTSSSPASSTSSNATSSVTNGPTVITHLGSEWPSVQDMQSTQYCQGNHMSMDTGGHQNCVSPPSHHHLIHHHHPHHFLPSPYPDSSLLHIA